VDKLLHEVSEALYDALSRERELLDNAVAMICALSENGSLTSVNPYGERLLGMPRDKILKTSVYDHIWPEDVVRADSEFNSIRYVSAAKSVELRIKSGSGLPIETRWSLQGTAGQTDIFCIVYDISEEKNIEALKQNFIDMVSDELRNPLKTMLSTVNSLLQGEVGQLSDESRPDVELAQRSVVRLIAFVNDFIDFQRLSAGDSALQFEPHLLHELVSEATAVVSAFAQERGVSLTTKLMDATIVCDRPKVVQMLVNLLTNAIKFSPAGGEVEIFYTSRGGVYSLGVSDTGPGIAPEYRERIFDAFEQVPGTNNKEGTGLGLAICKLMAQAHGWKISVEGRNESEFYRDAPASSGAVFCISIPSPLRFGQV
jgi:PAS domain S-box-containing protein